MDDVARLAAIIAQHKKAEEQYALVAKALGVAFSDPSEAAASIQKQMELLKLQGEPAAQLTDWITWAGGECPVKPSTIVDYIMRCETRSDYQPDPRPAEHVGWRHEGIASDVIAYRVVGA